MPSVMLASSMVKLRLFMKKVITFRNKQVACVYTYTWGQREGKREGGREEERIRMYFVINLIANSWKI